MKISFGNTLAPLEADAEKGGEEFISTENPAADLLKVAHHGSASSTNDDFLAAVTPRFAVISVGAGSVKNPREPKCWSGYKAESAYLPHRHGGRHQFLSGRKDGYFSAFGSCEEVERISYSAVSAAASKATSSAASWAGERR